MFYAILVQAENCIYFVIYTKTKNQKGSETTLWLMLKSLSKKKEIKTTVDVFITMRGNVSTTSVLLVRIKNKIIRFLKKPDRSFFPSRKSFHQHALLFPYLILSLPSDS